MSENLSSFLKREREERERSERCGGDRNIPFPSIRLRSPDFSHVVDLSEPVTSLEYQDFPDPSADEAMSRKDPLPYVASFGKRIKFTEKWRRARVPSKCPSVITLDLTPHSWRTLVKMLRRFAKKADEKPIRAIGQRADDEEET